MVVFFNLYDVKGLLFVVIEDNDLVFFFEDKMFYNMKGEVLEDYYIILFGKVDIKCEGDDIMLFVVGKQVNIVFEVVVKFLERGIEVEVLDFCSLFFLDEEVIFILLEKINWLIIIDEVNL